MTAPKGYSALQIGLHWLMAVFIVFQLIFGEDMGAAWRAVRNGMVPEMGVMVWAHIVIGIAVLLLVLWRLALRQTRGVPEEAEGTPLTQLAARLTHMALYALMLFVPMTGMAAWFGGVEQAGDVHELAKPAFIILIALHVVGALWHQFVRRDNLLARMKRPG